MRTPIIAAVLATMAVVATGCGNKSADSGSLTKSGLDPRDFISERDGKKTALYTLVNEAGMEVCVTNFGGRIVSVMVPDRNGDFKDVVLGFDSIAAYFPENNKSDFGASIGRYANRIDHGRIVIDGDTIQLPVNNFGHTLHGGPDGWQYKVYDAAQPNDSTVVLTIDSPDGDNNFPGNVKATVTYTLHGDNSLAIDYSATSDAKTVINMTNHSYFNLNGDASKPITDNLLIVNASAFTPVDTTYMTTGEILAVEGTPMDFRNGKIIGDDIRNFDFEQIKNGNGFDHNWVLDTKGDISKSAAVVKSPVTGIVLTTFTDEPGIQVYSGNFLDGSVAGKKGVKYQQHAGICLETQHYPDSPNKPQWPSVLLEPGKTYESHTVYRFTTEK